MFVLQWYNVDLSNKPINTLTMVIVEWLQLVGWLVKWLVRWLVGWLVLSAVVGGVVTCPVYVDWI